MKLSERFPDLYRYARTEAPLGWLAAAAVTTTVVAFCWAISRTGNYFPSLYRTFSFWESVLLFVYGTVLASGSVLKESTAGTWDAYRLTPLKAWEAALGRLFGAPIKAWFLWAVLLPWTIGAACMPSMLGVSLKPAQVAWDLASMVTLALLLHTVGLLFSAHAVKENIGRGGVVGAIVGIAAMRFYFPFFGDQAPVSWYGLSMNAAGARIATEIFMALWAFVGTCWRLGEDFLEERGWGRVPLFLITSGLFLNGFTRGWSDLPTAISMGGALFLFVATAINSSGPDEWKALWTRRPLREELARGPFWIPGLAAYAFVLALCILDPRGFKEPVTPRVIMAFSWFLFAVRDLCLLQWFRLGTGRAPEMAAFIYIVILYALPPIVLTSQNLRDVAALFIPAVTLSTANHGWGLLPASIMAFAAFGLLLARTRRLFSRG